MLAQNSRADEKFFVTKYFDCYINKILKLKKEINICKYKTKSEREGERERSWEKKKNDFLYKIVC